MSRFSKVVLPPGRELNGKASMTLLKHYQWCPRSGYFYARDKGEAPTMELVRGSAFHEIAQRATELMLQQGEPAVPGEIVKAIVNEVLRETHVPWREHDYLRECAYRWAAEWTVDPARVVACEQLVALELAGWQVRCKIDFAELLNGGMVCRVSDYKTARAAPAFEDIARKRTTDGRWAAKSFQLVLYALALAFGYPVREELASCEACDGNGFNGGDPGESHGCSECFGSGRVRAEIVEPFPVVPTAELFELELVFPGIEDSEGRMLRRPVSVTRAELGEYRESLIATLESLRECERTHDWPAIVSDEGCAECPCPAECPIPRELRDHRGTVNTVEQAREAAEVLERDAASVQARKQELRLWAKAHGVEIRYGRNRALRFKQVNGQKIRDKEALWDAVRRAREYGEAFDPSEYVQETSSSNFVAVTLTEDELMEREDDAA